MKTIFMGTPEFAIPSLEVVAKNTDLKAIFTKEDKVNARGNKIIFSPVKQFGIDNEIEVIQPKKIKDEKIIEKIKEINPDLIVVVAYGKILPKEIIDIPKYGIINVHSSLLPKYRGASPIHSAILNGDTKSGVSIMYIEEGLDSGDVILQESCDILENDTLGTLHDKLKDLGAIGLEKALKLIETGKVEATKQDESLATFVKPITKEQAKIDWNNTKEVIFNQVRGLNPFPAAHTFNEKDENIKIYKTEKLDKEYEGQNGQIVDIINKKGPVVKVKNGALVLLEVKFQGKKLQRGVDVINGRKMAIGECLK
ncbi:methionyl-tRNA formyltransferase [Leptotrichia sp. oral taxon 218]|uniref:methionyl-tRNA formyltransferase n=1 Tax=Leptotrichia sp. oral taxon 218 TaxID=712361 RepID=UPI001B8CE6D0|nr:methionyl-tRNA formyltransferase [Leptotrichia sp. oral taxon 218]QUB94966.1 methionyl-tRNA formyltransferase [Leptotrichia sp. oral taxon 218]